MFMTLNFSKIFYNLMKIFKCSASFLNFITLGNLITINLYFFLHHHNLKQYLSLPSSL